MPARSSPSRHVLPLFVGATVLVGLAFGWLGWRLLQYEQELAVQRIRQRLDASADLAVAALQRQATDLDARLTALTAVPTAELPAAARRLAERVGDGARLVIIDDGRLETVPATGLPYYPATPADDSEEVVFAAADTFEFARRDPAGAVTALRALATDRDRQVRAGALLRLGRNLQKLNRRGDALVTYEGLAALGATPVGGLPAGLVARYARCDLLEKLHDEDRLQQEARALHDDLRQGRWRIDRAAYLFYSGTVQRWLRLEAAVESHGEADAVAAAVELLWTEWRRIDDGAGESAGARSSGTTEHPLLLVWRSAPGRMAALIGGSAFVERQWLGAVDALAERQGVRLALVAAGGRRLQSQPSATIAGEAVRSGADTGLPWTLLVASANPGAEAAELATRRQLIVGGLAFVGCALLASAYAIGRAMSRELETARVQSDFVAAVSHEFRSPLTSMRQVTEMLAGGRVASDERRATYFTLLLRETDRLRRLVENLLDFGRAEAGVREYAKERLDLARLVRETVADFQREVADHGYTIEIASPDEDLPVRGDDEALRRAVWNLLDNAVKYSPDCRTVWVRIAAGIGRATIEVRDRGAGIAASETDAVFGKFVRGAAARATGAPGTGLGLAMVRQIVRAHGGEITVTSDPGPGSTFTIALPLEGRH